MGGGRRRGEACGLTRGAWTVSTLHDNLRHVQTKDAESVHPEVTEASGGYLSSNH